jgi:hypothetical protein
MCFATASDMAFKIVDWMIEVLRRPTKESPFMDHRNALSDDVQYHGTTASTV